ncbi:MAG: hypothetical protein NZ811_07580, partial [Gammaproteobacteria bacterium]|nr:hypothetical protein [Gammaproteobacteria bacterium]
MKTAEEEQEQKEAPLCFQAFKQFPINRWRRSNVLYEWSILCDYSQYSLGATACCTLVSLEASLLIQCHEQNLLKLGSNQLDWNYVLHGALGVGALYKHKYTLMLTDVMKLQRYQFHLISQEVAQQSIHVDMAQSNRWHSVLSFLRRWKNVMNKNHLDESRIISCVFTVKYIYIYLYSFNVLQYPFTEN